MNVSYRKTTNGEMNNGHCGNANNCYYKGNTVYWEIVWNGEGMGEGFRTKKQAVACVEYFNTNYPNWDGMGDVIGEFESYWHMQH